MTPENAIRQSRIDCVVHPSKRRRAGALALNLFVIAGMIERQSRAIDLSVRRYSCPRCPIDCISIQQRDVTDGRKLVIDILGVGAQRPPPIPAEITGAGITRTGGITKTDSLALAPACLQTPRSDRRGPNCRCADRDPLFVALSVQDRKRVGNECVSTCRSRWSPDP